MSSAKQSNMTNFTVNIASQDNGRKLLMSKTGTFGLVDENTHNNNRSTKIVKNEHTILEGFSEEEFSIENIKNTIAHLNP
mgnify:CR=1 FL=1